MNRILNFQANKTLKNVFNYILESLEVDESYALMILGAEKCIFLLEFHVHNVGKRTDKAKEYFNEMKEKKKTITSEVVSAMIRCYDNTNRELQKELLMDLDKYFAFY